MLDTAPGGALLVPLTPVLAVSHAGDADDFVESIGQSLAWQDDGEWARRLAGPFSWQLFAEWWAARRWVRPRRPDARCARPSPWGGGY